jgi:hypothetical protein
MMSLPQLRLVPTAGRWPGNSWRWLPLTLTAALAGAAQAATEPAAVTARIEQAGSAPELVLYWSGEASYVARLAGDQLIVWFDQPARFDLAPLETARPAELLDIRVEDGNPGRWLALRLRDPEAAAITLKTERRLVLALGPAARPPLEAEAGAEQTAALPTRRIQATELAPPAPERPDAVSPAADATLSPPPDPEVAVALVPIEPTPPVQPAPARPEVDAGLVDLPDAPPPDLRPVVEHELPEDSPALALLRDEIDLRDRMIDRLSARLGRLERQVAANGGPPIPPFPDDLEPDGGPAAGVDAAAGPGAFDVDEDALDRALERTLTRVGALLLPFGMMELEPSLGYVRRESDAPTQVDLFGLFAQVRETEIRRDELNATLAMRLGLPYDTQFEASIPYDYVDQTVVTAAGFTPMAEVNESGGGIGDISIGLAKGLLQEGAWWPDVVARIDWDTATGKASANGIGLGGGRHELTGSLSFVKSQDPLAFIGSLSYQKAFEKDGIEPGDRVGIAAGAVLAAGPDTSLRVSLSQTFAGKAEINGEELPGSSETAASLNLGASSVLGRGVLLDASASIGLTEDAPDYGARLALPIRFDLPTSFPWLSPEAADEEE